MSVLKGMVCRIKNHDFIHEYGYSLSSKTKAASVIFKDFSFFAQEVPGLYFSLGVNKKGVTELQPGNHSPYFTIDDDALDQGLKSLIYLTLDYPEIQKNK